MSAAAIAKQYEDRAIYVVLYLRGAQPGFHWGIFVPTATPKGTLWHATNRSGGWEPEVREGTGVPTSMSLCLAFKVGVVTDWQAFCDVLKTVPADGTPSRVTGENFSCATWAKDALHALINAGIIKSTKTVAQIQAWAVKNAEAHRPFVERGRDSARVVNQPTLEP